MKAPGFWWGKPGLAAALLSPIESIYAAIAAHLFKQSGERAGIPVICVGNLTVGGAGKTPTAIAIARMLIAAGEKPMFLTRGYGGRFAGPVMVEASHTAVQVGDEPILLAQVAPTVVAQQRVAGARLAKESGASVIVMDDGFQNSSLAKDVSILVVDTRGIGNGRVLPAGPLRARRDPQLDRASALLVIGKKSPAAMLVAAAAHARGRPIFYATLEPDAAVVAALAGQRALAFAGIGDPEKFFATLDSAGIDAPIRRGFDDHHRYTAAEARTLLRDAEQNKLQLMTTEKDLARLKDDAALSRLAERTRALPVTLRVDEKEEFERLVRSVRPA